MRSFSLLFLSTFFTLSLCNSLLESYSLKNKSHFVEAGVIINLGKKFFDEYKSEAVLKFMEEFEVLDLPEVVREDKVGKLNVETQIYNIDISDITFDADGTDI
jgi:hypothetical protein